MSELQLSRWFDDFRARGDAAALERVFDRAAPELLRLASHLAPDLAEAEDLVQASFVTAIERAAEFDAGRPLVPWLVGILGGHARNAARRRARRADPRELARPAGADPAEALERAELSGELRAALATLPELYREVLARHLFAGERAVDIAQELGRAPGTVRMQIARGLEQLRRALPAGALGVGAIAGSGTRGLAAVRAAVMQRAVIQRVGEATALSSASGAAATAIGIGGLAMGVKTAVGAAAALLVALAWWLVVPRAALEPAGPEASGLSIAAESASAAPAEPPSGSASRAPLAANEIVLTLPDPARDPDAPGWWLVGEVRGIGRALDDPVPIHVQTRDGGTEWAFGEAPGDGPYRVDLSALLDRPQLARRELLVSVSHLELESFHLPLSVDLDVLRRQAGPRKELRVDLELAPSAGFRGRVVLPDGSPAEGAVVAVLAVGASGRVQDQAAGQAQADALGAFALKSTYRGPCHVVAFLEGHLPVSLERERIEPGFEDLGELRLGAGGAELRGRVELPATLAGQRVRVRAMRAVRTSSSAPWQGLERRGERFVPTFQSAWSEPDGSFVLGALESGGEYGLYVQALEGGARVLWSPELVCEAPADGLVLACDASVVQVELHSEGELPADARVVLRSEDGEPAFYVDREGRFTALLDPRRDSALAALAEGYAGEERELPAAGRAELTPVRLALRSRAAELGSLGLELALVPGHGLADPQVFLQREGEELPAWPDPTPLERRDGALWIDALEPGRYTVRVEPGPADVGFGASSCYLPARLEVELAPGESLKRLVPLELGGAVRIRAEGMAREGLAPRAELLDASGARVEGWSSVTRHLQGSEVTVSSAPERLLLDLENALHPALPPGTYELRVDVRDHRCEPLRFTLAAGEVLELTLRLR